MLEDPKKPGSYRGPWRTTVVLILGGLLVFGLRLYGDAAKGAAEKEKKAEAARPAPAQGDPLQQQMEGTIDLMQSMMRVLIKTQANPNGQPNLGDLDGLMNQMLKMQMKQLQDLQRLQPPLPGHGFAGQGGFDNQAELVQMQRLGVTVQAPDETLADQLDLPRGQGLVLTEVAAGSAAAKGGLCASDVLLELDAKPVSRDPATFARGLEEIKANKPVTAVVLRRGKKTEVKGLSLPEAPAQPAPAALPGLQPGNLPAIQGNFPQLPRPALPALGPPRPGLFGPGAGGAGRGFRPGF